jgi:diacylglycerol kinase (ATP)
LKADGAPEKLIRSWKNGKFRNYDIGRLLNVENHRFFLESFGYGVFPYLMHKMKKVAAKSTISPEEELTLANEQLVEIVRSYKAKRCKVTIDGIDHSGKFILAEIMNTNSFGPNLRLSPLSDTGDGSLDVVLLTVKDRRNLVNYLLGKKFKPFPVLKGKNISISCESPYAHVDDQSLSMEEGAKVEIRLKQGLLKFLVP